MPTATSRAASFSPNSPMPIPATKVKPTRPAKPTCDSAWPANVWPRSTRKNPTVPANTAAIPEAAKAVRMKSYSNMGVVVVRMPVTIVVAMRVALDVDITRHDVIAILDAHAFVRRPIEARQHWAGDHLVDGADHRRSPAQIENAIDGVDEWIELVGAEQNRDLQIVANAPGRFDHALLMRGIKRDQRLVEQQQGRPADEPLAQQHTLALPARQFADRAVGEIARADFVERPVDLSPRRLVESGQAETAADRRAGDDVPASEPQARNRTAVLRHVADLRVAACRRPAEHGDPAGGDGNEAERGAHEGRLAGAVRA